MKKVLLMLTCVLCLSSCGTLFTPSKQPITFMGMPETRIYDNGKKLGEIAEGGTTTIKVRKKLSNKTLIAKKDGYKNTPVTLDATFNPVSIINLTNILAWAIDLGTGKCCKWDTDVVEIEMEKSETEK
ncbi:MAG: hypothetical protein IKZ37_02945 [Bacteroidaceae bacterium]|nr:hypothetical protein [Bacteroidaceae bacterium]